METEDVSQVSQLEQKYFSLPWSYESILREVKNPHSLFCVAEQDGHIVGYGGMLLIAEEGDITNIVVEEAFRGQGLGRKLMEFLLWEGQQSGIREFTLEVRVSNESAIRLYRSLGFSSEGIRPKFYAQPEEDAYIMWKRLQKNC